MRKLKRLMAVPDKEFFSSPELKKHFEELAMALTRERHTVNLEWDDLLELFAITDGSRIIANPGSSLFSGLARDERYRILYGLIIHEIGHLLYSDFKILYNLQFDIKEEYQFIREMAGDPHKERIEYLTLQEMKKLANLLKQWENCIEDGYIENVLRQEFEGLPSAYLRSTRSFFAKDYPTVSQSLLETMEKDHGNLLFFHDMILAYATTGFLSFTGCDMDEKNVKILKQMLPVISKAVVSSDSALRWKATFDLLMLVWPDVEKYLHSDEELSPGSESDLHKGTKDAKRPKKTRKVKDSRPDHEKMDEEIDASISGEDDWIGETSEGETPSEEDIEPEGDESEDEKATESPISAFDESALKRLMSEIADRKEDEDNAKSRKDDATSLKGSGKYSDFGSVPIVPKEEERSRDELYHRILDEVRPISKRIQRTLLNELSDREKGSKRSGLIVGKRFEARDSHRKDLKFFSSRTAPREIQNLAVEVLCDLSGSMSRGIRMEATRKMAVLLQDFCSGLGFPCAVLGHTATHEGVIMTTFCEWSDRNKESMGAMGASRDNQDGAAIRYGLKRLLRRPEPYKLMIYISDGMPLNCSYKGIEYHGVRADNDVKDAVKEVEKAGVILLCCGISDDNASLKELYGDHFMDITDLNRLPVALVKYLKKRILEAV